MCIPRFWRYHVFSVSPSVIMICSHDIPSWESHMCVQGELLVVCLTLKLSFLPIWICRVLLLNPLHCAQCSAQGNRLQGCRMNITVVFVLSRDGSVPVKLSLV